MNKKNLFIPLIKKYFLAFADGSKGNEYRLHGKRWNERTCYVGREVVLSLGYGKRHRLRGKIVSVRICMLSQLEYQTQLNMIDIYKCSNPQVIDIGIEIIGGVYSDT